MTFQTEEQLVEILEMKNTIAKVKTSMAQFRATYTQLKSDLMN